MMKLDIQRLKDYPFWLAEYNTKPTYYYDFQMWQYASDGYVPGISGDVDMNISFRDFSKPGAPSVIGKKQDEQPAVTTTSAVMTTAVTTTAKETTTTSATTTKKAD
jgi:GH25 family lysozyme M1 (1,4-beta-N-acetylmuramidase)